MTQSSSNRLGIDASSAFALGLSRTNRDFAVLFTRGIACSNSVSTVYRVICFEPSDDTRPLTGFGDPIAKFNRRVVRRLDLGNELIAIEELKLTTVGRYKNSGQLVARGSTAGE